MFIAAVLSGAQAQADTLCGNLPQLDVKTPSGLCVGVVMGGLRMPRGILPLADGRLLVVEMGNWVSKRGALLLLQQNDAGQWTSQTVLSGLDRPHGVALGPDGKIWVGETNQLIRLPLSAISTGNVTAEIAIPDLPSDGLHPLKSFAFSARGDLYVNIGSSTDNCESEASTQSNPVCGEALERGLIRHYLVDKKGKVSGGEIFVSGLRNSVGLAIHHSGTILQAENSRDAIHKPLQLKDDNELPHDELNVLESGKHYGWPYCYDKQIPAPEFPRANCSTSTPPYLLLPAHAAPLSLGWWRDTLVIAYHGYRANGHRLVSFQTDKRGLPVGNPVVLIDGWKGMHGNGAPVDIRAGTQGRLFISDDKNGQVLVLQSVKP